MVPVTQGIQWKPSILVKEDFKGPTNLDISNNFLFGNVLWLGGAYRMSVPIGNKAALANNLNKADALIGMAQVYVNSRFRVGYSYDYGLTSLTSFANGTHELSIGLSFGRRTERVLNPRFF